MTTYIFNAARVCVSQSRSLAGAFTWARRAGGVLSIDVFQRQEGATRPGALVRINYRAGYFAETYFRCGPHAEQWAKDRRAQSPRVSWFGGCAVSVRAIPAGGWNFNRACGSLILGGV